MINNTWSLGVKRDASSPLFPSDACRIIGRATNRPIRLDSSKFCYLKQSAFVSAVNQPGKTGVRQIYYRSTVPTSRLRMIVGLVICTGSFCFKIRLSRCHFLICAFE